MSIETIVYGIFIIILFIVLMIVCINILKERDYSTKFYNYNIKYDTPLDKNYIMLKKQKLIIIKKKTYLLLLKVLVVVKGK